MNEQKGNFQITVGLYLFLKLILVYHKWKCSQSIYCMWYKSKRMIKERNGSMQLLKGTVWYSIKEGTKMPSLRKTWSVEAKLSSTAWLQMTGISKSSLEGGAAMQLHEGKQSLIEMMHSKTESNTFVVENVLQAGTVWNWLFSFGATCQMCINETLFLDLHPLSIR